MPGRAHVVSLRAEKHIPRMQLIPKALSGQVLDIVNFPKTKAGGRAVLPKTKKWEESGLAVESNTVWSSGRRAISGEGEEEQQGVADGGERQQGKKGRDERTSSIGESYQGAARRTAEVMSRRGRAALRRAVCGRSLGGRARGIGTGVGCTSKWGGERNHERGEGLWWRTTLGAGARSSERGRKGRGGERSWQTPTLHHTSWVSFFTARLDLV